MHKRLLNEATIHLTIEPDGPILIKAGSTGADPTRPDMEFVRTWHDGARTVFLPGPSLKGVLRAHCERIVRSFDETAACNPVDSDSACSETTFKGRPGVSGEEAYEESCFACRLFGNTVLAGRFRTADAYPVDPQAVRTEERDGVAIDRIYGSVAFGPFQLEVATTGRFETRIQLHNFTLAQLALTGLALRDLKLGRVGVGFGKSRGLGRVTATFDRMTIRYPACQVEDDAVTLLGGDDRWSAGELAGVGRFPGLAGYGFPAAEDELAPLPEGVRLEADAWGEATLEVTGNQVEDVWRACVPAWKKALVS